MHVFSKQGKAHHVLACFTLVVELIAVRWE